MYEIHITCYTRDELIAESVAKDLHWKTSKIAGDPVLGKDTYFYLTTHTATKGYAFEKMDSCRIALEQLGVEVVREKIEDIIHDIRFNQK